MSCESCGLPIYPLGTTYIGQACPYQGHHQTLNPVLVQNSNLEQPIKELTEAIKALTKALLEKEKDNNG